LIFNSLCEKRFYKRYIVYDVNSSIFNHDARRMINARCNDSIPPPMSEMKNFLIANRETKRDPRERNLLLARRKSERNWNLQ